MRVLSSSRSVQSVDFHFSKYKSFRTKVLKNANLLLKTSGMGLVWCEVSRVFRTLLEYKLNINL